MSGVSTEQVSQQHQQERARYAAEVEALERRANGISIVRLVCFAIAAIGIYMGISQPNLVAGLVGVAAAIGLFVAVVWHSRVYASQGRAQVGVEVHERHLLRVQGKWQSLPDNGAELAVPGHAYAHDIDLLGPGSLLQRIDTSQTLGGARMLARWLREAAEPSQIRARQGAVQALADDNTLRWQLEVAGSLGRRGKGKLDPEPFLKFTQLPALFAQKKWLKPLVWSLPVLTLALFLAGRAQLIPGSLWLLALIAQIGLLWATRVPVHHALDLVTSRLGLLEAAEACLTLIERSSPKDPHLAAIQQRLNVEGEPPSVHLRRLRRYEGFAQLRTQGPVYLVLNVLTLWDLFCLERLEHFNRHVGPSCADWFDALAEFEALCSLASLHHSDPSTSLPTLEDEAAVGLQAEQLAHPLLPPAERVANDVSMAGPASAVLITGSNMAGKSTLLRAVGLNVALALAGGPVCARSLRLCRVRLRASMRIDDSLQQGASYFRAELNKLRGVVDELEDGAPVLFLLDELLRGTNARARHQGAHAVLEHLLDHGAFGLVATHDVALAAMAEERPNHVRNQHFTDVFEDGEMRFDYQLRDGVVRTSNALRLLRMAGIHVPDDADA